VDKPGDGWNNSGNGGVVTYEETNKRLVPIASVAIPLTSKK
jgi:hypothetical protein